MKERLTSLSLQKKLLGGFIIVTLLTVFTGVAGLQNVATTITNTRDLVEYDIATLTDANELQVLALTHRRYEKDFFLNIGKPDKQKGYLKKFDATMAKTHTILSQLALLCKISFRE